MLQSKTIGSRIARFFVWLVVILLSLSCVLPLSNMVGIAFGGSDAGAANPLPSLAARTREAGKTSAKVEPLPTSLTTLSSPPWRWATWSPKC